MGPFSLVEGGTTTLYFIDMTPCVGYVRNYYLGRAMNLARCLFAIF